jgi:hypothetical protein
METIDNKKDAWLALDKAVIAAFKSHLAKIMLNPHYTGWKTIPMDKKRKASILDYIRRRAVGWKWRSSNVRNSPIELYADRSPPRPWLDGRVCVGEKWLSEKMWAKIVAGRLDGSIRIYEDSCGRKLLQEEDSWPNPHGYPKYDGGVVFNTGGINGKSKSTTYRPYANWAYTPTISGGHQQKISLAE